MKPSKDLNNRCKKILFDRMNDKINGFELGEEMYELHKDYPNAGFDVEADKIINRYINNKKSIENNES